MPSTGSPERGAPALTPTPRAGRSSLGRQAGRNLDGGPCPGGRAGPADVDPRGVARRLRASYQADLGDLRSFLPDRVPVDALPGPFERYLSACAELPERYPEDRGGVRGWLASEFASEDPAVSRAIVGLSNGESETLMTALSVLGHTYRWDRVPPASDRFE